VSYEEADSAFRAGRYDEAARLFARYTEGKPENPFGHYMLGLSAWKSRDHTGAEAAFERALALDPDHVKSYLNLARVLLEVGRTTTGSHDTALGLTC
jgi:Flp pilus assembly protein TadD